MAPRLDSAGIIALRRALRELPLAAAHASAAQPPDLRELYAPDSHEAALDPERALVIGNRGVGKSFWSAVLADETTRRGAAAVYRRIRLDQIDVVLGFHEAAGKVEGPAPSPSVLRGLLASHTPEAIWRGVLVMALGASTGLKVPRTLREVLSWIDTHLEEVEAGLRRADLAYHGERRRFVLLFDALDRIASDWDTIRRLTEGLLRFVLDLRGYRALRAKLFMRTDQAGDSRLFQFPDASKLRAERVELRWQRTDLFGLVYRRLWHHTEPDVSDAFRTCVRRSWPRGRTELPRSGELGQEPPRALQNDEVCQEEVFSVLAGPYMGANHRRGRTYTWLHAHLADAFGETSPRSFLIALRRAAQSAKDDLTTVLDHQGIRVGVQEASTVRVEQLAEDYGWIGDVLRVLEKLEVPCEPKRFTDTWRRHGSVQRIRDFEESTKKLGPLELADNPRVAEDALLVALENLGVLERRDDGRINVPDIFRVAAKMKRRGGVPALGKR